jgi:hypothetical protein
MRAAAHVDHRGRGWDTQHIDQVQGRGGDSLEPAHAFGAAPDVGVVPVLGAIVHGHPSRAAGVTDMASGIRALGVPWQLPTPTGESGNVQLGVHPRRVVAGQVLQELVPAPASCDALVAFSLCIQLLSLPIFWLTYSGTRRRDGSEATRDA